MLLLFIAVIIAITLAACETNPQNKINLDDDGSYKQILRIKLNSDPKKITSYRYVEKIRRFEEERRDVEVEFITDEQNFYGFTPSLLGKSTENAPDLIELTSNQMQMAYYHGKLEALPLSQLQNQNLVIASPEGDVIGLKTQVNPMIVYYNKDVFSQFGMEPPSGEWDWAMLENTITALKAAEENVYILFSPITLEWVTINRYDGTIVDPSGTVFTGYMNGEEALQAAEWLLQIESRDDLEIAKELIDGNIALAIDFAYNLPPRSVSTFEAIIRNNDRIGIAPLPGGPDALNVAYTFGLVIPKNSENKDLAMELLNYLTKDTEAYYEDILWYSLQADSDEEVIDPHRFSLVKQELKRSVPVSVFMSGWQRALGNHAHYGMIRNSIKNGQSAEQALEQFVQRIDTSYGSFKEDLALYEQCIYQMSYLCY